MNRLRVIFSRDSPSLMLAANLIVAALGLVAAPIIARAIGPAGRGETATALALFYLVPQAIGIGVPLAVRRFAAIGRGAEAVRGARVFAAFLIVPSAFLAGLAWLTVFSGFDEISRTIAALGIVATPLTVMWLCACSVFIAQGRFRALFVAQVTQPLCYVIICVVLWITNLASTGYVLAAQVISLAIVFTISQVLLKFSLRGTRMRAVELVRDGRSSAGGIISEAMTNRLDQVIMIPLIGASQAGFYSVALTIAAAPIAVGHAIGGRYFREIARANPEQQLRLSAQAVRETLALVLIIVPIGMLASIPVIPWLFGIEFVDAVPVTIIALLGTVGMVTGFVASNSLIARGLGWRMTASQVVATIAGVIALLVAGPLMGAIGAAIASAFSYSILLVVTLAVSGAGARQFLPRPSDVPNAIRGLLRHDKKDGES